MTAKTIWIVNQYAGSPRHGMEYRHYHLAKEFINAGHKVCIVSGSYSHLFTEQPKIKFKRSFAFEDIERITYCWVKVPVYKKSISIGRYWNMLIFAYKLILLKFDLLPKPDIVIVSSPSLFPVYPAVKWKKQFQCKFIFEVRDIWPLTLREVGRLSPYHPAILLMSPFEKAAYKKADYIVSLLPEARNYYESKGMKNGKFVYIPNGIVPFEESEIIIKEFPFLSIPKFNVGYLGTLGTANGLESFIKAAQLLKHNEKIHFILVGQGDQKEHLMNLAKDLLNITFIDAVNKKDVRGVLKLFDACFIGLKDEPLFRFGVSPNKLFEYMQAGKPVIYAINSGNHPVEEAKCGISVKADDPNAIAGAIKSLSELNINELKIMGENGKKFVLKNHSYSILAKRYLELF
jgi:glycosyltransferase involved in cell wall biosynthesis